MTPAVSPGAVQGPLAVVPRLILGDHGFLRKYGSRLPSAAVRQRMEYAVSAGISGLSAGDPRVLKIAAEVASTADRPVFVLHHTDLPFRAEGRRSHFGRCMSTIADATARFDTSFLSKDPLMGAFLATHARFRPYRADETFEVDHGDVARLVNLNEAVQPTAISIGGDYLDALHVLGRLEVAHDAIGALSTSFRERGLPVILTSYVLGLPITGGADGILSEVDAVMVPVNALGHGMCPSERSVRTALAALGKPVIAMHALASGSLQPRDALSYVFGEVRVHAAVVGASRVEHIDRLAAAMTTIATMELTS